MASTLLPVTARFGVTWVSRLYTSLGLEPVTSEDSYCGDSSAMGLSREATCTGEASREGLFKRASLCWVSWGDGVARSVDAAGDRVACGCFLMNLSSRCCIALC